jgi:predicted HAD superfamily Cof-like phosphohydrolase
MNNPIKEIYRFNQQAGLLENGYNDFLESSFQIEEALEGFDMSNLSASLNSVREHAEIFGTNPKEVSRALVRYSLPYEATLPDVDRLDKACDAVVFAVGSMAKLGLNPQQITKALNVVMKANFQKLSMPKDGHGKLTKPSDFVGPESDLQKILDERTLP